MDRKGRIISNSLYNIVGLGWQRILAFVVLPFVVPRIGADAYGVMVFSSAFMGYFAIFDLGLGEALIKYLSQHYALRDFRKFASDFWTSTLFYGIAGVIIGLVIFAFSGRFVHSLMKVPPDLERKAIAVMRLSALGFALNMAISGLVMVPRALQRYDVANKITLLIGTVTTLGMFGLVYFGYGIFEITLLNVALAVVSAFLHAVVFIYLAPKDAREAIFDLSSFKRLVGYGAWTIVSRVTSTIMWQIDKLIISAYLPIQMVAFYNIPLVLSTLMQTLGQNLTSVVAPAASELHALDKKEELRRLYLRSTLYTSLATVFMSIMLFCWADKLLLYWMGPEFMEKSTLTCRLLVLPMGMTSLVNTTFFMINGLGRPEVNSKFGLLSSGINLPMCLYMIPKYGIIGAPLAMIGPVLIAVPIYVLYVNKKFMELGAIRYVRESFTGPAVAGAALAATAWFTRPYVTSLLHLLALGSALALSYFVLCWFGGIIHSDDRATAKALLMNAVRYRK